MWIKIYALSKESVHIAEEIKSLRIDEDSTSEEIDALCEEYGGDFWLIDEEDEDGEY